MPFAHLPRQAVIVRMAQGAIEGSGVPLLVGLYSSHGSGGRHHGRSPDRYRPVPRYNGRRRLERNRKFVDSSLEEAVTSEPVSDAKFPASWENTGNLARLSLRPR